jgi:hypothetical protein
MPNGNPEFRGADRYVKMYRGGEGSAMDLRGMKQGYLISKLMAEWRSEDRRSETSAAATRSLPASQTVTVGEEIFKKPLLLVETVTIVALSQQSLAAGDALSRANHSVSSSKTTSDGLNIGNSAYVGMTPTLSVAQSFCAPSNRVWKYDIWLSDLWQGGKEDEWLARGGTRVFNVELSKDGGKNFGSNLET